LDADSTDPLPELLLSASLDITSVSVISVVMLLLLVASALISASEVAVFGLRSAELEKLADMKTRNSKLLLALLKFPKRLLATILISNNFVNVAIVILSTLLTDATLGDTNLSELSRFLIQVVGVTLFILLFGEVFPKVYATRNGLKVALAMALPLTVLRTLFNGPSKFLVSSTKVLEKRMKRNGTSISVGHLEQALELTSGDADTSENEQRILEGIVRFGNTDVKQIMSPRTDVTAFDRSIDFRQLVEAITESGYSRIPIYNGDFDHVEGVVYAKDLIPHLNQKADFNWTSLLRTPFFVPESKKLDDLLKDFQERKMHMAIVVDEYGGSSGIVTLEDILEEIVGDITDEFDDEAIGYTKIDGHTFIFEGKTPLVDVYRVLDIDGDEFEEAKGESDTLAGFLMEISGKIMRKNERIGFGIYQFTITAADKRRIRNIRINRKLTESPVQE
jgi:gliding motility-associated protein GldE